MVDKVLESLMHQRSIWASEDQKPGLIASHSRSLSDELLGQAVLEIRRSHEMVVTGFGEQITLKTRLGACNSESCGL